MFARNCFLLLPILISCVTFRVAANGYYTIVAPKVLRPNLDYHVSVSVHNVDQPVRMVITLGGRTHTGNFVSSEQNVFLQSDQNQVVNFQIGMWGTGNYSMRVSGSGGLSFVNETELIYEHKSYMVFIQTDKAIYKPSQPVLIRVIVVSPSLRPTGTELLDIFVTDGRGNRVKQWNRVFTTRGVFSTEMPLSEEPVLGDWNITVNILDQTYKKSFTVAEYVLPSFEVKVDVPTYATFNASDIVATVTAKYTYGKPVKGKAVVMVTPLLWSPQIRNYYRDPLRKIVDIDGKVDIPFNLYQELNLEDDFRRMIRFEVVVTEAITERRENATAVMGMVKYKEKIELIKTSETFKPGLKFSAFFKVATYDDIPIQDTANPLIIRYGYSHDDSTYDEMQFPIPANGTIPFTLHPPLADNIHQLIIIAKYKDVQQYFPPIRRAESPSNTFIQAVLVTEHPKVEEEILINVNSTAPMTTFNVVVLGRGDIVFAETVQAHKQKTIAVRFPATNSMAPRTRFLIYYTTADGEVVADGLSFEVEGVFRNSISLESSRTIAQPGETVNFQVTTSPDSFVGLLAVDQSVLLLKSGNDITQDQIRDQLEMFDSGKLPKSEVELIYSSIWFPGSKTANEVFTDAGVMTLSNALIYDEYPYLVYRKLNPAKAPDNTIDEGNGNPPPLRSFFPETWLWENLTTGGDGKAVITREAPDTITSWVLSAFSLSLINGLAVTPHPSRVTVFRPFFISLNLPYAVVRHEAIAVQVVVFNYMKQTVTATITMENMNQFDFVTVEDVENEIESLNLKTKSVIVESGEPASVYFMIIPKELGYIDVKVTARSDTAGDALTKKLLVKPEGVRQNVNKAFLVVLPTSSSFETSANITIPKNVVSGSEKVEISAIADVMGPTIDNFDNLLELPFGCGEQNMVRFVPNIVAIDYLRTTNQLKPAIEAKALTNMETGYQRELTYKRDDGSFSAFGHKDSSGSTWLTAFVMKSFAQAKPFITIDEKVINASLNWLIEQQVENGSFPEVGSVSNKDIQGGAGKGTALTAYVLLAFIENKAENIFSAQMTKSLHLLEREVESVDDPYALSIITYALHVIRSQMKDAAFRKLQSLSITNDEFRYWRKTTDSDTPSTFKQTKPIDIEMSAYALMTYVLRDDLSGAIQIMKWLVTKRNANGGFLSTQDTVIAIQALTMLAKRIVDPEVLIDIIFTYDDQHKTVKLNRENAMTLLTEEIPASVKTVNISATGKGFAIVQVSYSYNIMVSKEFPAFQVNPFVDRSSTKDKLQLNICVAYGERGATSNMAVMDVTLPSGFVIDRDSLPALHGVNEVKRVDIKDRDTSVIIYFDKLDEKLVCPTIKAFRTFRVAKQQPTAVYVYDYYDQAKAARHFYKVPPASLCDLCDGDECNSSKCRKEAEEQRIEDENTNHATRITNESLVITSTVFVILINFFK